MKKTYFVISGKCRKFKNSKISKIFEKMMANLSITKHFLSINFTKCQNEDDEQSRKINNQEKEEKAR